MSESANHDATTIDTDTLGAAALDETTQAQLDQRYWMTDTPVREIA